MSLLRKLGRREDLFRDKSAGQKAQGAPSDVLGPSVRAPGARPLTAEELQQWSLEKATEMTMLKEWLRKQPHLPRTVTDEQLLVFLHSCWNSVEQTKTKLDNHYTIRTHAPEIFTDRGVASKEVLQALRVARISSLRNATPKHYNAIFVDCVDPDVGNYNFVSVLKATTMAMDTLVRYHPREENNILVLDMRNSALAHVLKTNLATLKKAMLFAQTSLPFRLKEIHVINAFPLIHQIQTMLRPFIDSNLGKMIHIHMQDNMETFYKFVPKNYLPREYGGNAPSLQDLNDALKEMMREQQEYLTFVEKQVVNEYQRADKAKSSGDVFGLEGSFRKLEFD